MNKSLKISIVIPNWNGKEYLRACLRSLEKQTRKDFVVIVVENGSRDGSAAMVAKEFPKVELIQNAENLGFAGGVNCGIRVAKTEYVVLLNNDTLVDKAWLHNLVGALERDHNYDFATSKMVFEHDRNIINSAGDGVTTYGFAVPLGLMKKDSKAFSRSKPVFSACGGAAVYRTRLFTEIGLFDEKFFAYLEDVDISFRAQLAGHRCLYVADAVVYHHGSATTKQLSGLGELWTTRNSGALFLKNFPAQLLRKYFGKFLFAQFARLFMDWHPKRMWWTLRGQFGLLVMLPHIWRERKRIQAMRTVDIEYIHDQLLDQKPFTSMVWRQK